MTTPKLLTRDELLRLGGLVVNGDEDSLEAIGHICRHLAALLPADGALPPIDNADEQIVDALVAKAQEGRTSRLLTPRQVTQTIEDLREAVRSQLQRERDAAIARAEAAERRLAELKKRHGECSKCNGHGETQDAVISGQFYMCSDCDGSGSALLRSHILEAEETKSEVEHYRARAEAAEKRVAELERDLLEIAHATGIVYEAEGHAPKPGPTDAIVQHIKEDLLEQRDEARDALRDALTWMGQTNEGDTEERRRIIAAGWAALEGR